MNDEQTRTLVQALEVIAGEFIRLNHSLEDLIKIATETETNDSKEQA